MTSLLEVMQRASEGLTTLEAMSLQLMLVQEPSE